MKKPVLLTLSELMVPINLAFERIEKIRIRKASNDDEIILEGLFVLAVASFENSLNDTLKILLSHIPDKLDGKLDNILKEDLIEGSALRKAIQNKLNSISYKNLNEIISYFIKITSINENCLSEELINKLREIKATRNLLIHNNLYVNDIYNEVAGKLRRQPRNGNRLDIKQTYLLSSLVVLNEILSEFKYQLSEKYNKYSKLNAVKNLWEFIFTTPIMKFEEEWEIDVPGDFIRRYKKEPIRKELSSSEQFFLSTWLSHFYTTYVETVKINYFKFDSLHREKFGYLISVIDILKEVRPID